MAKKLESGSFAKAEPWREGRVVVGAFKSIEDVPNADSRKIILDANGQDVAVWETGVLARFAIKMQRGVYYRIMCNGKNVPVKDKESGQVNKAWGFTVEELENDEEVRAALREAANHDKPAAGSGKPVEPEGDVPF